jgi:hypothetical protein
VNAATIHIRLVCTPNVVQAVQRIEAEAEVGVALAGETVGGGLARFADSHHAHVVPADATGTVSTRIATTTSPARPRTQHTTAINVTLPSCGAAPIAARRRHASTARADTAAAVPIDQTLRSIVRWNECRRVRVLTDRVVHCQLRHLAAQARILRLQLSHPPRPRPVEGHQVTLQLRDPVRSGVVQERVALRP